MKKYLSLLSLLAGCGLFGQTFFDDFDRGNNPFQFDPSINIGPNYALTNTNGATADPSTPRRARVRILDSQVQFNHDLDADPPNASDVILQYEGLNLLNSNPDESFTVNATLTSHDVATAGLLYGVAFNIQEDGSFYAARIRTGNSSFLQFVRYDASTDNLTSFGNIGDDLLGLEEQYSFEITSSSPGIIGYQISGPGITGGGIQGSVSDSVLQLEGGYAGLYISSANSGPRMDSLSIQVVPEPSTYAVFAGILVLTVVLVRVRARRR